MIQIIRVQTVMGHDLRGEAVLHDINHRLKQNSISNVQTTTVYRLEGISEEQAKVLAEKLLCEEINQEYSLNAPSNNKVHTVEIAYKPGVMNPEVASLIKAAKDLQIPLQAADSSREYAFFGNIDKHQLQELIQKLNLFNKTVEYIVTEEPQTLVIKGSIGPTLTISIREMTDEKLMELSKDKLFLNVEEMKVIQSYFQKIKRDPTDCELETLAQTWSEHCAHKTFKAKLIVDGTKKDPLIKRIQKEALKHKKYIVSAFVDNSGVMRFFGKYSICGKVETHNSPSAIEPYGGAATGSGGVFRDIAGTGLGAKNIVSTDIFCFAPPTMNPQLLPSGCLPPDYLLKRVVTGVKDYGNRMGIPTNNGSVHFHNDFRAKPTILVGAYGIIPTSKAKKRSPKKGDRVVVIGGRTGRDGIHGATFASGEMTDRTITVNSSAVQIGNAIEEKRMFDALLEARDKRLIRAIQDVGGGGFSSAIGEMGSEIGVTIDLQKAKLKYDGLAPWEIWISESQERMALAIPQNKLKQFLNVCKKYNIETSIMGTFDGFKKLKLKYGKKVVCKLDMKFLHHGLPQRTMIATKPPSLSSRGIPPKAGDRGDLKGKEIASAPEAPRNDNLISVPKTENEWVSVLTKVLSHGNICSKEPIVRLYDHTVQGTNIVQPFSGEKLDGPNDAVVLRPLLDKPYGMVVAHGINPVLNTIDPYLGSLWACAEGYSNYVAVGGDPKKASLINNYSWPFPDEKSLWALDQSVDAVVDFMKAIKLPVISGKDSLSSTYKGKDGTIIKIPPVLCVSVFGKIDDVSKTVTSDFKKEESVICLVGLLDINAMGESVYFDVINSHPGGNEVTDRIPSIVGEDSIGRLGDLQSDNFRVPQVDLKNLPKIAGYLHKAIQKGKILSCHDISEGGLLTAVFEMCVGGDMGASLVIPSKASPKAGEARNLRPDYFLFNETAGCFVVEIENEKIAKQLFREIPHAILGTTTKNKQICVNQKNKQLFMADIEFLKKSWQEPMRKLFS